jgi:hypothetical protein
VPADFDEVEFGSRRAVRASAADALFRRVRRPDGGDPPQPDPPTGSPARVAPVPGAPGRVAGDHRTGSGEGAGVEQAAGEPPARKPRVEKERDGKSVRKRGSKRRRAKRRAGKAPQNDAVRRDPAGGQQASPTGPGDAVLVPIDQWTKVMNQLGNLHEAGQQIAEARERAARAETEVVFLRERLKEMRAEIEVDRRRRPEEGTGRGRPAPEGQPPVGSDPNPGGPPAG